MPARDEPRMDETRFTVWRVGQVDVVGVDGVVDFTASMRLRLALFGRVDAGAVGVVVDLTRARELEASAVNVLLRVRRRLAGSGGWLVVRGARGPVLQSLETADVAQSLGAEQPIEPWWADADADGATTVAGGDQAGVHGVWGDEINRLVGSLPRMSSADRQAARADLVRLCLPYVQRLARRFYGLGESRADLNQVAALGLMKAVDRYNPQFGTDFPSYAIPTVIGELKRHFRDYGWSVRVPRRLQELRLEINRAREELTYTLKRSPTVPEIAEYVRVDEEDIVEALVASAGYRARSLFASTADPDDMHTPADLLAQDDPAFDAVDSHESLQPLLAQLPSRQREIISMRFYGNMTQLQIAERLGISQMQVSRLLSRTLAELRVRLVND
jgi:RNA polymerase sigma-B factor